MEVDVCVVFTVRERYAHAPKALEALYANTRVPFRLLVVDAATPKRYLRRIEAAVQGRPRVEFLRHDGYLLPNQARNLAVASVREPFVLFLENDCETRPGCLERLLAVSRQSSSVAVPWLWEDGSCRHFDAKLGHVRELAEGGITIDPGPAWTTPPVDLEKIEFFESHCYLMPRTALETCGPFDGELNVGELIDSSLAVRRAGVPAYQVPGAEVDFFPPPPVKWDELPHYRLRWDIRRAEASFAAIEKRWRIPRLPQSMKFVRRQHLRISRLAWGALMLMSALKQKWRR